MAIITELVSQCVLHYALSFVPAVTKESAKEKCLVLSILNSPSTAYVPRSLY